MAAIDVLRQMQVDRIAPRAIDRVRPHDIIAVWGYGGDIEEVAVPTLSRLGAQTEPMFFVIAGLRGCQFTRSRECQMTRPG
jgi:hypothetical protein